MHYFSPLTTHVCAVVSESLPSTGLVYLEDADFRTWVVTRATRGGGLDLLRPGRRVDLTIADYLRFALVEEYDALD
jgi:hypothetical protein